MKCNLFQELEKQRPESPYSVRVLIGVFDASRRGNVISFFPHLDGRGTSEAVFQEGNSRLVVSFRPRARGLRRGNCGSGEASMLAMARSSLRAAPIIAAADSAG